MNSDDEKIDLLMRERKLFKQQLEEAHLHLLEIKSSWSAQNLSLETQVDRLSRQVAAETTEKNGAIKIQEDLCKQIDLLGYQLKESQSKIDKKEEKVF